MPISNSPLDFALSDLQKGKPVILYDSDSREGEADLIIHSSFATPKITELFRRDGGGMIVLAIGGDIARTLALPFLNDLFVNSGIKNTYVKTNYGDAPPYTIPINHTNAHTGVTDNDKSLALLDFSKIFSRPDPRAYFEKKFRTPGHLPICISRGLSRRRGHTELAVELAKQAGFTPSMVLCEMLGSGVALSKNDAEKYAKKNRLTFVEGKDLF